MINFSPVDGRWPQAYSANPQTDARADGDSAGPIEKHAGTLRSVPSGGAALDRVCGTLADGTRRAALNALVTGNPSAGRACPGLGLDPQNTCSPNYTVCDVIQDDQQGRRRLHGISLTPRSQVGPLCLELLPSYRRRRKSLVGPRDAMSLSAWPPPSRTYTSRAWRNSWRRPRMLHSWAASLRRTTAPCCPCPKSPTCSTSPNTLLGNSVVAVPCLRSTSAPAYAYA